MRAPDRRTCEVKIGEAWRAATLMQAKSTYATALKRCPACHGQVFVTGTYTREGSLRLQHRRSHSGCPLTPENYAGRLSQHPQALA